VDTYNPLGLKPGTLYRFEREPVECGGIRAGGRFDVVSGLVFHEARFLQVLRPNEVYRPRSAKRSRRRGVGVIVGSPNGTMVFIGSPANKEQDVSFHFGVDAAETGTSIEPAESEEG
jgi:hypothetical protein